MIVHIVFLKLKEPYASNEGKTELKNKLDSLAQHIHLIKKLEVGINFSPSPNAMDVSLLTHFDSLEDLKQYAIDPYHKKVLAYISDHCKERKVVDYEV